MVERRRPTDLIKLRARKLYDAHVDRYSRLTGRELRRDFDLVDPVIQRAWKNKVESDGVQSK